MTVVGFTGHQDIPRRATQIIGAEIERVLSRYPTASMGVSSLAAGADQLFAEAVLRLGWGLSVIIPSRDYDTTFTEPATLRRFRVLLTRAERVEVLDHSCPSEEAYLDAGMHVVDLSQVLLAVWDGQKARGKGGTADIVRYARERNVAVAVVWPPGLAR
jgi:hypothetical protein